jgi:ABC-2 type transport system permease protein/lipopolysaccharide transport system permease protein
MTLLHRTTPRGETNGVGRDEAAERPDSQVTQSQTPFQAALDDVLEGLRRWELWGTMGWYDVRQHYRRSVLGPFWLTLSMALMVVVLGFLYGGLFGHSLRDYLPYLALGLIFWGLMSSFFTEGCNMFTGSAHFIREVNAPLSIYVYRQLWKNLIILAHNALVYMAVAVAFGIWPGVAGILFFPGLVMVAMAGLTVSVVLGLLTCRFRDIPPIVTSVVQILFFVSPILWKPEQVPARALFVDSNPFFHFLNIVRQPLLGEVPDLSSWVVALALTAASLLLASLCFVRFRRRIAYWV